MLARDVVIWRSDLAGGSNFKMVRLHGWQIGGLLAGGLGAHIVDLPTELFGSLHSMAAGFPRTRELGERWRGGGWMLLKPSYRVHTWSILFHRHSILLVPQVSLFTLEEDCILEGGILEGQSHAGHHIRKPLWLVLVFLHFWCGKDTVMWVTWGRRFFPSCSAFLAGHSTLCSSERERDGKELLLIINCGGGEHHFCPHFISQNLQHLMRGVGKCCQILWFQ